MPNNASNIIDSLSIELTGKVQSAVHAIGKVSSALYSLKDALSEISSTKVTANIITKGAVDRINEFGDAIKRIDEVKLNSFVSSLSQLANFGSHVGGMNALGTLAKDFAQFKEGTGKSIQNLSQRVRELEKNSTGAAKAQRKLADETKKASKSASHGTNAFTKLLSSIKRIVFYRAIRSALRAFTQGFSEGIQNLYRWSQAVGTSFAPAMDRLKTATLYLKNGFASMWSPLIEQAIPVIDALIDKMVEFFNFVQEGFARLTGQATWNKALKYPVQYAEALDDASASAKAFKNQLMGFDELNVINTPTDSSRGKGSDELDYSAMFMLMETATSGAAAENFGERLANQINDFLVNNTPQEFEDAGETIGNKISDGAAKAIGDGTSFFRDTNWEGIGTRITSFLSGFFSGLSRLFDIDWGEFVYQALDSITRTIEGMDISKLANALIKFGLKLAAVVPEIAMALVQAFYRTLEMLFNKMGMKKFANFFGNSADFVGVARQGYTTLRKEFINPFIDKLVDGTGDWGNAVSDTVGNAVEKAFGQHGYASGTANGAGASFGDALSDGISFDITPEIQKEDPPIQTWWSGFKQRWGERLATVKSKIEEIGTKISTWWSTFKTSWGEKVTTVKSKIEEIGSKISTWWSEFRKSWGDRYADVKSRITNITTAISDGWSSIKKSWSYLDRTLGISAAFTNITSAISTGWQNIKDAWASWRSVPISIYFSWGIKILNDAWDAIKKAWGNNKSLGVTIKTTTGTTGNKGGGASFANGGFFASGGFPDGGGSLFWAGEGGVPELLGTVGGRNAVAGGAEITGIREAIIEQGAAERQLLTQLISAVASKDLTLVANSSTGRWVNKALKAYSGVTG